MQIYPAEEKFKHLINDSSHICAAQAMLTTEPDNDFIEYLESAKKIPEEMKSMAHAKNPHLLYGKGIFVSTTMNGNDEIFIPEEVWAARFTPVNTHMDVQHQKQKIIGHNYGVRFLDAAGKEINPNQEKVPEYFDIESSFVMYKSIFPETVSEIQGLYKEKKGFISMECGINGFDYGFIDKQNRLAIIKRDGETAHLSANLRCYGGPGVFKEWRLGRVVRNINFKGSGWVNVPANPASIITYIDEDLQASKLQDEIKTSVLSDRKIYLLL
jgi:hypothetical protein